MIRAEHLCKSFDGRTILDDICVEFDAGKTNLIIGRSGSGKTVLLKSLVGLHEVDSGHIFFDDKCYDSLNFQERRQMRPSGGVVHRCAICGRTQADNPDLEFRYCSKCEGGQEYCQDHLFTHVHVKAGEKPRMQAPGGNN